MVDTLKEIQELLDRAVSDSRERAGLLEFTDSLERNVPRMRAVPAVWIVGPNASGKSEYARLLEDLIGSELVVKERLLWLNSRFSLQALREKKLFICEDQEVDRITLPLQVVIKGDYVRAEVKHQDPVNFRLSAKVLILSNGPEPNIADDIRPRILVVHFQHS